MHKVMPFLLNCETTTKDKRQKCRSASSLSLRLKKYALCAALLTAAASSLLFVQICHNMRSSTAQGTVAYHPESTNKCTSHKFFSYFSVYCSSLALDILTTSAAWLLLLQVWHSSAKGAKTSYKVSLSFQFLISIRQDYSISVFRLEYLHLKLIFTSSPLLSFVVGSW